MLQDWNDGAIKYFTQPPREAAEVTIVSELAAEFDRAQANPNPNPDPDPYP